MIARLMGLEAASLAVMSTVHLTDGQSGAGIPEALIFAALAAAAAALALGRPHARALATGALVFAIVGFLVGLRFTISDGGAFDLAYHATGLPLLVVTLVALRRRPARSHPLR